ncbi:MAG: N-acetylmuramoyl-L-alanine amidase [Fibrobacter sp.]|nr:N-acetylmuramoyl-L-alanine amidase [Fibrobacter sp.]
MKIVPQLLDKNNRVVGSRVLSSGKDALWGEREKGLIDVIVIHYISAVERCPQDPFNTERILGIFCDYDVSSHFLIGRDGVVLNLVPVEKKAWHCGGSIMPEPDCRTSVNEFSIGIELAATAESGFTVCQYAALSELCCFLEKEFNRKFIYTGHDQIAGEKAVQLRLREQKKEDPGELFNWNYFFECLEKQRAEEFFFGV